MEEKPKKPSVSQLFDQLLIDQAMQEVLTRYTKALAQYLGPIAKIVVKEGVVQLAKDGRFTQHQLRDLASYLSKQIPKEEDRAVFKGAIGGA